LNPAPYSQIPLVKGLPLVGNLPQFLRDPLANAPQLEAHGTVVRSRTFFETVTLLGPEGNQFVLHDREGNFSSRGGWGYWIDAVFPGAIMAMDDPAAQAPPPHHAGRVQALGDGALPGRHGPRHRRRGGALAARAAEGVSAGEGADAEHRRAGVHGHGAGPRGRPHEPRLHRHRGSQPGAGAARRCRRWPCGAACGRGAGWCR
jgi:hypothetical protein